MCGLWCRYRGRRSLETKDTGRHSLHWVNRSRSGFILYCPMLSVCSFSIVSIFESFLPYKHSRALLVVSREYPSALSVRRSTCPSVVDYLLRYSGQMSSCVTSLLSILHIIPEDHSALLGARPVCSFFVCSFLIVCRPSVYDCCLSPLVVLPVLRPRIQLWPHHKLSQLSFPGRILFTWLDFKSLNV